MKENELARLAVTNLRAAGVAAANLSNISEVENDAPFVGALVSSGLLEQGMRGLKFKEDDELSATDLDVLVKASRGMHAGDAWIRGDIMKYIRDTRYRGGDIPRAHMDEFARQFGCSTKRLLSNLTTSVAWDIDSRYPSDMLSNTQHEILNTMTGSERTAWAERAIAEGMTVQELRDAVALDKHSPSVAVNGTTGEETVIPSFVSDHITPGVVAAHMYKWYEKEVKKTGSAKQAFENVIMSFHENGLLKFPMSKWAAIPTEVIPEQTKLPF